MIDKGCVLIKSGRFEQIDSDFECVLFQGPDKDAIVLLDLEKEIYDLCDGKNTVEQVISILHSRYGQDAAIEPDVLQFFRRLVYKRVLVINNY